MTQSRTGSVAFVGEVDPRSRAEQVKQRWFDGAAEPDALAAFREMPELLAERSVAIDLAYEEYCLRTENGEDPDPDAFCERFPTLRCSLHRLLAAHHFLEENPDLLAAESPTRWPNIGEQLGDWHLRQELGRGSFARVYLASESSTGDRPVVLKVSPEIGSEARTLGRLSHPGVVPILSARRDPGWTFGVVCMPYLGRATLADVMDGLFAKAGRPPRAAHQILEIASGQQNDPAVPGPKRAPSSQLQSGTFVEGAVALLQSLAGALAFLHEQGVYHRDLKPSNILVCPDGRPMLLDFNLAADGAISLPRLGGTLPYMAPEHLRAMLGETQGRTLPGPKADVFSLGVIACELLTGAHPHGPVSLKKEPRESARELLLRQETGRASLRQQNPQVDRSLEVLLLRCLSPDPVSRPCASDLARGLARWSAPRLQWQRWAFSHPRLLGTELALMLTLGVVAVQTTAYSPAHLYRERGAEELRAGNAPAAISQFTRAIELAPRDPQTHFQRGRAYLQSKKLDLAAIDLQEAVRRQPKGAYLASLAYCQALRLRHEDAIRLGTEALESGEVSAAIYNNRARSRWYVCRRNLVERKEATLAEIEGICEDLAAALRLEPRLQAAYLNRAGLAYDLQLRGLGCPSYIDMREDIEQAIRCGAPTSDLHFLAACIYAIDGTPQDSASREQVMAHLARAAALGLSRDAVHRRSFFRSFVESAEFDRLPWQSEAADSTQSSPTLIDPAPAE